MLFTAALLLVMIGLAAVYSVDLSRGNELTNFKKQLIALGIGLTCLFWAGWQQSNFFRAYAKWWYLFSAILLVLVLVLGQNIRGTRGWFNFAGFSFQPVELAKIGLILLLSYIIANFGRRFERPLFFFGSGAVTLFLMFLVMLQPDLGSAVILGTVWFGLMCLVGARRLYLWLLVGVMVLGAVLGWFFFLQDYQKDRLITFVNPSHDSLRSGYNVNQAIIAVGAGKIFGRGLGFGSQSQLRFLPEAQTDFVFSVVGEELGLAGILVLLVLFGVFFWRLFLIVRRAENDFVAAAASATIILFFSQFFINIGANLGLLPVTGVTLPFVSYGGSSLIINLLLVGIMESVGARK